MLPVGSDSPNRGSRDRTLGKVEFPGTAFTRLVGCRLPIQLAAMGGGVTTTELIAAVSGAAGLGMLQRGDARSLGERLDELADANAVPCGVNFVPPLGQDDEGDIELAASRTRLVEFFYADRTRDSSTGSTRAAHSPVGRWARERRRSGRSTPDAT